MLQALSGMAKSRDVWPCNAGPPNGPGARRVSATRQGCTATNCNGACAKAAGETVNKANTTTDKKAWRMECIKFLLTAYQDHCVSRPAAVPAVSLRHCFFHSRNGLSLTSGPTCGRRCVFLNATDFCFFYTPRGHQRPSITKSRDPSHRLC